jgi:CDP-glycerol glycerophosphotransferase (TagB/SpsB family)
MARFTFAAGNARKILRLPLYALGALASFVVPRSRRLWVLGSGIGLGEGALPLYREARSRLGDEIRIVWLASTAAELAEARRRGLDAEAKSGFRGFRLTLRARVLVVTHGFGDVNRYGVRGGFVVQLWHGVPLKRLHLDAPAALRVSFLPDHRLVRAVMAFGYRAAGRGIGLFPVASELVAARIATAFAVPRERIVVTGDPRDDAVLEGAKLEGADASDVLGAVAGAAPPGARAVLHAPTWRDGARDPAVPTAPEWTAIAAWLEAANVVLYVRTHPLAVGDYAEGPAASSRIRLLGADVVTDIGPLLPAFDAVLTDYSSIAFDFALLERPMAFLAPDLEFYTRRRGTYAPYREFSGGRHVATWAQALEVLDAVLRPGPESDAARRHARRLRDEHFDVTVPGAAGRVLDLILSRTGELDPVVAEHRRRAALGTRIGVEGELLPAATLRVRITGDVDEARIEGARARVEGRLRREGGVTIAEFPLLGERWGTPGLALPSGEYRLVIRIGEQTTSRVTAVAVGEGIRHPRLRAWVASAAGGLVVTVTAPLADDERGLRAQRRLDRDYRRARPVPERAVFFESFYGQTASCNPLGIDRALARIAPEVTRYWSVVDGSIAIPEGGIPLIEGSREWWRVRGSARALVVNDWLRKRFRPRRHQRVLQTWHGTMLKRLALDRPGRGLRTRIAILRERDRWDVLLAQNAYSARIFRSAYAMRDPIWEEGYPRNDVLSTGDAAEIRRRIGVPHDARLVLYAPTWRDDRTEMVDFVDLEAFAGELGDGHVLLVRGHSRTLRYGQDLEADHLVDVTSYPSMAELLLVTDVLVTDYSSVMFDFASTGRAIVLFTPDLAHYAADLRGFYFDLLADAPGPIVTTREELRDEIVRSAHGQPAHADRARAWRERFTPHDDGMAGERVVRRMLDAGWFD